MDEHLKRAKEWATPGAMTPGLAAHQQAIWAIIQHLEAQKSSETPQSETPSPAATSTQEAIRPTWSISSTRSSRVNRDGKLWSYPPLAISDWLNSLTIPGGVQEVEIGVTLTSKAAIPPSGSPSPSTEAPMREASGVAGERKPRNGRYFTLNEDVCPECGKDIEVLKSYRVEGVTVCSANCAQHRLRNNADSLSPSSGTSAPAAGGGEDDDWDFEYLPTCNFPHPTRQSFDGQDTDCGEPAVAKVWWTDYDKAWPACQSHLDALRRPSSSPSTSAVGGEREG